MYHLAENTYRYERGGAQNVEREATAAAHGTTTAMPTKTTKVTDLPGEKPKPLARAEIFDQMVIETYSEEAAKFDQLRQEILPEWTPESAPTTRPQTQPAEAASK